MTRGDHPQAIWVVDLGGWTEPRATERPQLAIRRPGVTKCPQIGTYAPLVSRPRWRVIGTAVRKSAARLLPKAELND